MESLRLNKEYRNNLYYKKYRYRVSFYLNSAFSNRNDSVNYLWALKTMHKGDITIRVELDHGNIYGNDLELLQDLSKNFDGYFVEAIADAPKGVLLFKKKPKHNYRVFLKKGLHKGDMKNSLINLLNQYKNTNTKFSYSHGLLRWLNKKYNYGYMYSTYFIDYDHESVQLILALHIGESLDKTYKLEHRK